MSLFRSLAATIRRFAGPRRCLSTNRVKHTLVLEPLESRWCPALTLTQAGLNQGLRLSVFADNFPTVSGNDGNFGPFGITFPKSGGVLVSDLAGHVRLFPTDSDGQDAANAPVGQDYGQGKARALATFGGANYMTEQGQGKRPLIVEVNDDGTFNKNVLKGIKGAGDAIVGDSLNGDFYISLFKGASSRIIQFDPASGKHSRLAKRNFDGLALSTDGTILYAREAFATGGGHVVGFDVSTKKVVFDSGLIDGTPDGVGVVGNNLYVSNHNGTVEQVNLDTGRHDVIASGGSRGDLIALDPNDGSLLITQSARIYRLEIPHGQARSLGIGPVASMGESTITGPSTEGFNTDIKASESLLSPEPARFVEQLFASRPKDDNSALNVYGTRHDAGDSVHAWLPESLGADPLS